MSDDIEKTLNSKIDELMLELEDKDREIFGLMDKVEQFEETVMRLEALVPTGDGKKDGKKGKDSKLLIQFDEQEKQMREIKNKLGFLRKEKVQLQQELEKVAKSQNQSVIRIPDKKSPLDALVAELQGKINKQRLFITKLKQKTMDADTAELNEEIRKREEEIDELRKTITELEESLKKASARVESSSDAKSSISKKLTEELQNKLNKAKREIQSLREQLKSSKDKKGKKGKKIDGSAELNQLQEKIDELREELDSKRGEIERLKVATQEKPSAPAQATGEITGLTEELQNKLNKSKIQIKTLQEKLKQHKKGKAPAGGAPQEEIEGELSMQKEMVISLQQQIDAKESELGSFRNEATQSKIKCEDLENQVKLKETKINDLKVQLETLSSQAQGPSSPAAPVENPQVELRFRELRNMLEDLNKQNVQQRMELSELKKSMF